MMILYRDRGTGGDFIQEIKTGGHKLMTHDVLAYCTKAVIRHLSGDMDYKPLPLADLTKEKRRKIY